MDYAKTHEDWVKAMKEIAHYWSFEYKFDEGEAFSALLVAYAEALAVPKKKDVAFDTIFYYYKKKTLRNLIYQRNLAGNNTVDDPEFELFDYSEEAMLPVIKEILFELDSAKLDEETLAVLTYIKSEEFAKKEHRTIGERTIIKELVEKGWAYRKAMRAVNKLGDFYRGYYYA